MANVLIIRRGGAGKSNNFIGISGYNYTGNHRWEANNTNGFKIKFLTSGVFTPLSNVTIDVFLVGGGGGAGGGNGAYGGETFTQFKVKLKANTAYPITIGAGGIGTLSAPTVGGSTEAFGLTARGGQVGVGSAGGAWDGYPGKSDGVGGQNRTTKEFNEPTAIPYSGGGGARGALVQGVGQGGGTGGHWGGGRGAKGGVSEGPGENGIANSGGGGGGGRTNYTRGGYGGSGVVIIRGHVR